MSTSIIGLDVIGWEGRDLQREEKREGICEEIVSYQVRKEGQIQIESVEGGKRRREKEREGEDDILNDQLGRKER